jgi:hypothetical protein
MKVYNITMNGTTLSVTELVDTLHEIENSAEIGDTIEIDVIEMSKEDFDNLPEFDGF